MSREREKENEVESIDHFYHHHPLILGVVGTRYGKCYGCRRYIRPVETAYICREGCGYPILHEECAEMPREIKLSMHPQHTLIQKEVMYVPKCAVCEQVVYRIGYYCASVDRCTFQVHVGCAQNMEVLPSSAPHPSHPQHQLTSLWRPGRSCSLRCDACGTIQKGNSYMCMVCQYWIHDSCFHLSPTMHYDHHEHPLSLVYHLPLEYIKFNFTCDICLKALLPRYWVYRCETCRYVVHIKCAIRTSSATTINIDEGTVEDVGVITFPINNVVEELIGSFVTKVGEVMSNPNETVNGKYEFHNHDHQLHLVVLPHHPENDQGEEEEEDDDDGEDDFGDDFHCGDKSQLACDGCTMPLFSKKQKSSHKYFSCGECKYFLHWACFHLPQKILSHPLHPHLDHNLTLQARPKLDFVYCKICRIYTNGLFYKCTKCEFKVDIKCASLPNTIKHKAHLRGPRHHLKLLNMEATRNGNYYQRLCSACGRNTYGYTCYQCDICEIILHSSCALLPAVVSNPSWDKHRLPLTFDASKNHPSSFNCDICEQEMNPKSWMYHCRTCDFSAHPNCFPVASGEYRNIKFGQWYVAPEHHHPLTYQLLTTRLHCDVCKRRKDYGCRGFRCTSHKCEFFMCLHPCGRRTDMKAID